MFISLVNCVGFEIVFSVIFVLELQRLNVNDDEIFLDKFVADFKKSLFY